MKNSNRYIIFLSLLTFLTFISIFVIRSLTHIRYVPFYEFDEAHRAETAKRMLEYKSYLVPLTGSPFDRPIEAFKVPLKENPFVFLYYHLERPPFVYMLMMVSSKIFGSNEFAYRFPSFVLGMGSVLMLIIFTLKSEDKKFNFPAFFISLMALITSADLWLSSQYAQLDTGISLFLFSTIALLILFIEKKNNLFLILSGISYGLAILSKGQPAIIIIFPLIYCLIKKYISFKDLFKFIVTSLLVISPWAIYIVWKFGLTNSFQTFFGFGINSTLTLEIQHKAPFIWYAKWWLDSFRPGWIIFASLTIYDLLEKNITRSKAILLVYIICGLIIFSIPENKIWWYTLPLTPAVCSYIYLSTKNLIEKNTTNIFKLAIIILISSVPIFLDSTTRISVIYGLVLLAINIYILLNAKVKLDLSKKAFEFTLLFAEIITLIFFLVRFPEVKPYISETKPIGKYYASIPGKKCLWSRNLPIESLLFYSDAGEISLFNPDSQPYHHCTNYMMIDQKDVPGLNVKSEQLYKIGNIELVKFE